MAKLGNDGFDACADENQANQLIAPGRYDLIPIATELVDTKAGTGKILKVTFEVVSECAFKGSRLWENFNWTNPNATAQRIGRSQFATVCRAVNKPNLDDSDEILNIPFKAKVVIEENQNYGDSNKIDFKDLDKSLDGNVRKESEDREVEAPKAKAPWKK